VCEVGGALEVKPLRDDRLRDARLAADLRTHALWVRPGPCHAVGAWEPWGAGAP
jgi:hypothetical protein